jgi:hypothetical protein
MGNHVKAAPNDITSMDFNAPAKLTVIGNITTGGLIHPPTQGNDVAPEPADIQKFNLLIP